MARYISHTLILEGELVAETPLHIGGADTGHTTDMPLAVNGRGGFYLPGTSLAGAIRTWWRASAEDAVWGYAQGNEGHASFVLVDDAPAVDGPCAELWHGVGIDRRTGGACKGIKFDREVLPQGTRFKFRLTREVADRSAVDQARQQMGTLLAALETGSIPFGGGTTRGFGRLSLKNSKGLEVDWGGKAGLLIWLGSQGQGDDATVSRWRTQREGAVRASDHVDIQVYWQPRGPLMSKSARDGMAVDMLPFVSRNRDGNEAMVLPGSAIKGALRSHAERIVRTVLGEDGKAVSDRHFEQVDVPLVCELFGTARPADKKKGSVPDKETKVARGLLAVDTCYSVLALDRAGWNRLDVDAESWRNTRQSLCKADHVAIDRWTGGASDGALFSAVEPDRSVQWQPLRLRLDCRRGASLPVLALLWLVLADLVAGRVPLGFGVNRGYGDLVVRRVTLSGLGQFGLKDVDLAVDRGNLESEEIVKRLKPAWTAWLAEQQQETIA